MKKNNVLLLLILSFLLALAACSGNQPAPPAPATANPSGAPATAAAAPDGKAIYQQSCAMCHGDKGVPDEPNQIKATNLTDGKLQAKWTDAHLKEVVEKGTDKMPPTAGLSSAEVDAVVKYTRALKQ